MSTFEARAAQVCRIFPGRTTFYQTNVRSDAFGRIQAALPRQQAKWPSDSCSRTVRIRLLRLLGPGLQFLVDLADERSALWEHLVFGSEQ